jgi:lipopolysaccharide transport system permease protein
MSTNQRIVIESNTKSANYWKDLWNFRGLFYFLAWRDVLVRYKQTAIGLMWSVLRPLITIVVFTLLFNKIANFSSQGGVPYAIMVCAGMLPWQFFANAFNDSANSLIGNSNLLTKVYFPRLIVPVSSVIVSLLDFCISIAILVGLFVYYQYVPGWKIIFFPFFLILAVITSIGAGVFIGALNVKYRDFRYIIPFVVQFGFFVSPVGYSSNAVYTKASLAIKYLYSLNPMVGIIDGFRWTITGEPIGFLPGFYLSVFMGFILLVLGIYYFRKTEKTFADII